MVADNRSRVEPASWARVWAVAAAAPSAWRAPSSEARSVRAVPSCVRSASGRAAGSATVTVRRGGAVIEVASTMSGRQRATAGVVFRRRRGVVRSRAGGETVFMLQGQGNESAKLAGRQAVELAGIRKATI